MARSEAVSTPERPEPDILAEFAAFREELLEHILDAYDVPEDLRQMWRELR